MDPVEYFSELIKLIETSVDSTTLYYDRYRKTVKGVLEKERLEKPFRRFFDALDPDEDFAILHFLMYGKRVSKVSNFDKSIHVITNPFLPITYNEKYRRDDEIPSHVKRILLRKIGKHYTNAYVFTLNMYSDPTLFFHDVQMKYPYKFNRLYEWVVDVDNRLIILYCGDHEKKKINEDDFFSLMTASYNRCHHSGAVASHWDLANLIKDKICLPKKKKCAIDCDSVTSLKYLQLTTEWQSLEAIADDAKENCHILASATRRLILNSPSISHFAASRIFNSLTIAVFFHLYNYDRFSAMVYDVVHEVSIGIINSPLNYKKELFRSYCALREKEFAKELGFETKPRSSNSNRNISILTKSGLNAAYVAFQIAFEINHCNREVVCVNGFYFEYDEIFMPIKFEDYRDKDHSIFFINSCPIYGNKGGFFTFSSLDKFITNNSSLWGPKKTKTIMIDGTSCSDDCLYLSKESQRLIDMGYINVIFMRSHQKFFLLHTDQSQLGSINCLFANDVEKETIDEIKWKSERDFLQFIDLQVGAFIYQNCVVELKMIRERHFKNGLLLQRLNQENIREDSLLESNYPITGRNYNLFIYPESNNFELYKHMACRDSFGHAVPSYLNMHNIQRIAPGASNSLDEVILSITFNLQIGLHNAIFSEIDLINHIKSLLKESAPIDMAKQIFLLCSCQLLGAKLKKQIIKRITTRCPSLRGTAIYDKIRNFNYFKLDDTLYERIKIRLLHYNNIANNGTGKGFLVSFNDDKKTITLYPRQTYSSVIRVLVFHKQAYVNGVSYVSEDKILNSLDWYGRGFRLGVLMGLKALMRNKGYKFKCLDNIASASQAIDTGYIYTDNRSEILNIWAPITRLMFLRLRVILTEDNLIVEADSYDSSPKILAEFGSSLTSPIQIYKIIEKNIYEVRSISQQWKLDQGCIEIENSGEHIGLIKIIKKILFFNFNEHKSLCHSVAFIPYDFLLCEYRGNQPNSTDTQNFILSPIEETPSILRIQEVARNMMFRLSYNTYDRPDKFICAAREMIGEGLPSLVCYTRNKDSLMPTSSIKDNFYFHQLAFVLATIDLIEKESVEEYFLLFIANCFYIVNAKSLAESSIGIIENMPCNQSTKFASIAGALMCFFPVMNERDVILPSTEARNLYPH